MKIWIDADAAPRAVKDIVFRAAQRLQVDVILVANQRVPVPPHNPFVSSVLVKGGPDVADQYIADHAVAMDLAITADIPLAAVLVRNGVITLDPRGERYTTENIGERLSVRDFMDSLRGANVQTTGAAPYGEREKKAFAGALDRALTAARRHDRDTSGTEQRDRQDHWSRVYTAKPPDSVSWFQPEPTLSLTLIRKSTEPPGRVLDVGGGASCLADRLLAAGFTPGVLDISPEPLELVRQRLGAAAGGVRFIVADVTRYVAAEPWDVWHDRAVFHFLTSPQDRAAYRASMLAGTRPGGTIIVATFGPEGPRQCSGLPTMRYSAEQLTDELGPGVELREHVLELHRTPSGGEQQFVYCRFVRCEPNPREE